MAPPINRQPTHSNPTTSAPNTEPVPSLPKLVASESNVNKKNGDEVRQRIREIKETVMRLEQQREESLDTQWKLFLEAEGLQQKKLELRAESHRIYSEIVRKFFALR